MNAFAKSIRVLIVEDTRTVAEFLAHILASDPRIQVVGVAVDGEAAVETAQQLRPDVITMDVHMPKMNGFEATRRIMELCPTPIVIVCGAVTTDEVAINFHAMEAGALAVVARPSGPGHERHEATVKELVSTVKLMSEVRVVKRWPRHRTPVVVHSPAPPEIRKTGAIEVIAIGASTGGPLALQTILTGLPKDFPFPLLIVQHMTPGFVQGFVEWLGRASGFAVRIAVNGEPILPGQAYIAPDDVHMGVRSDRRILLAREPRRTVNGLCPSVSFLFGSVAQVFGANAVGVLLTGMGRDGVDELKLLKDVGAITMAQDESSSVVHGMPGEAIQIGAAQHILPPQAIARTLVSMAGRS
jgi:two-component system chemotaxis response regulator CheB